jgi:hypothetical protein
VTRTITAIRGVVRAGLSGGPGVDGNGRVRTVVFARRVGESGGFGVPADVVRAALERSSRADEPLVTDCVRS